MGFIEKNGHSSVSSMSLSDVESIFRSLRKTRDEERTPLGHGNGSFGETLVGDDRVEGNGTRSPLLSSKRSGCAVCGDNITISAVVLGNNLLVDVSKHCSERVGVEGVK